MNKQAIRLFMRSLLRILKVLLDMLVMYKRADMVPSCLLVDRYDFAIVAELSCVLFKDRRAFLQYSIFC